MKRPVVPWWCWCLPLPVVWWGALQVAARWQAGMNLLDLLTVLSEALTTPTGPEWCSQSPRFLFLFTLVYALVALVIISDRRNYRRGEEHGSAQWGDARVLCKKYRAKPDAANLILTQNFRIGLDGRKHLRNLNILVVGGSGSGKSRSHAIPNILQCCCSFVVVDCKGEILRKTGALLKKQGYEVRVFDLINPDSSFGYNPFNYVHDDRDVLRLINNLIRNTTPKGANSSDPFWEKSETALLQALMLYLLHEAPPQEQNFAMIMELLRSAEVKEDDPDFQSPLDMLFERLEMREPDSIALKQYQIFKQAADAICSK